MLGEESIFVLIYRCGSKTMESDHHILPNRQILFQGLRTEFLPDDQPDLWLIPDVEGLMVLVGPFQLRDNVLILWAQ